MQQTRAFQRLPAVFALAAMLAVAGCAREAPEQALREQVARLQQAIDARDAGDVQVLLDREFVGNEGMDRDAARRLAASTFLRYRDVGARFGPLSVELRGEADAVVRFSVLATGGSGALLPQDGQVFDVQSGWRLVDGEWRLRNARWTPRL